MSPAGPVALTGATGFLGRHVAAELARAGVAVRILARTPPDPARWSDAPAWRRHPPEVVTGDLADAGALERLLAGAGAV
ncbi:MAG: NAD-dependent epimerase/dehydratase family protein, partial [Acetobacteraceae bacterium]